MKIEGNINKNKIKKFVLNQYGLEINKVEFVPKGEVSYGYVLTTKDKKKFFAKIFPKSRIGQINAKLLDFSLNVAFQLYAKCGIDKITYPILTKKNKLNPYFEDMPFVLFEFIEGKNEYELKMDNQEISNLAKVLAEVHKCVSRLKINKPLVENFALGYKRDLLKSLKELENPRNLDNKYKKKLAKMILPVKESILYALRKTEKLAKENKKKDFVICHTDAIDSNLIINNKKEVFIIDWDGVLIAPKEHDLWFYLDDPRFLKAYEKEFGKFKLNKKAILFYIKDRILEDLTDLLVRVLHDNDTDEQNKRDLYDISDYSNRELKIIDKKGKQYSDIVDSWNKR